MFNGGMLAIELPKADIELLFSLKAQGAVEIAVDLDKQIITAAAGKECIEIPFELSQFDKALVAAGGWVDFADARY